MRKKTNIDKAKEKIRLFIIAKNVIAYKFAFKGDISLLQCYLYGYKDKKLDKEAFSLFIKAFGISSALLRSVDSAVVINGKKTWLSKIVIKEMIDNNELIDTGNSYKASKVGGYSKCYPLNDEFIEHLTYDEHYKNLSDPIYDEVRKDIEGICKDLDIYQHDDGHQAKLFERTYNFEFDLDFFDGIEMVDLNTNSHEEWLRYFYNENELKQFERLAG